MALPLRPTMKVVYWCWAGPLHVYSCVFMCIGAGQGLFSGAAVAWMAFLYVHLRHRAVSCHELPHTCTKASIEFRFYLPPWSVRFFFEFSIDIHVAIPWLYPYGGLLIVAGLLVAQPCPVLEWRMRMLRVAPRSKRPQSSLQPACAISPTANSPQPAAQPVCCHFRHIWVVCCQLGRSVLPRQPSFECKLSGALASVCSCFVCCPFCLMPVLVLPECVPGIGGLSEVLVTRPWTHVARHVHVVSSL